MRKPRGKPLTAPTIADFAPDPHNANQGTERGRSMLEHSLRTTGAGRSILVDKQGNVIAGNKTLEAWGEISEHVQVVHTTGQELVIVQRDDLDLADPTGMARQLAYFDNRTGEVGLAWDADVLAQDVQAGVDVSVLWNADELQRVFTNAGSFPPDFSTPVEKPPVTCPECGHTFIPERKTGQRKGKNA